MAGSALALSIGAAGGGLSSCVVIAAPSSALFRKAGHFRDAEHNLPARHGCQGTQWCDLTGCGAPVAERHSGGVLGRAAPGPRPAGSAPAYGFVMVEDHAKRDGSVQSVHRAISILQVLALHGAAGVTQIAAGVGIHKSTVFRLLATLESRGLVEQDVERGR